MPTKPSRHSSRTPKRPDQRPASRQRRFSGEWQRIRKQVIVRDDGKCKACGVVCGGPRQAQVDHIQPHNLGGTDALDNLQLLCLACHGVKTRGEDAKAAG